jgi:hypothetical protein
MITKDRMHTFFSVTYFFVGIARDNCYLYQSEGSIYFKVFYSPINSLKYRID